MVGINPFAKKSSQPAPKKSGFERLDPVFVDTCKKIGKAWHQSPQNRRVMDAAASVLAGRK